MGQKDTERLHESLAFVLIQPGNMYFLLSLSFITRKYGSTNNLNHCFTATNENRDIKAKSHSLANDENNAIHFSLCTRGTHGDQFGKDLQAKNRVEGSKSKLKTYTKFISVSGSVMQQLARRQQYKTLAHNMYEKLIFI